MPSQPRDTAQGVKTSTSGPAAGGQRPQCRKWLEMPPKAKISARTQFLNAPIPYCQRVRRDFYSSNSVSVLSFSYLNKDKRKIYSLLMLRTSYLPLLLLMIMFPV